MDHLDKNFLKKYIYITKDKHFNCKIVNLQLKLYKK